MYALYLHMCVCVCVMVIIKEEVVNLNGVGGVEILEGGGLY